MVDDRLVFYKLLDDMDTRRSDFERDGDDIYMSVDDYIRTNLKPKIESSFTDENGIKPNQVKRFVREIEGLDWSEIRKKASDLFEDIQDANEKGQIKDRWPWESESRGR